MVGHSVVVVEQLHSGEVVWDIVVEVQSHGVHAVVSGVGQLHSDVDDRSVG